MMPASPGAPVRWFVELLDVVGSQPVGGAVRQCPNPGHGGDAHPSLSVSERDGGGVRLHCFAGCPEREVLRALGLGVRQLYRPPAMSPRRYAEVARLRLWFAPVVLRRGHPASRGFRLEAVHRYDPAEQAAGRVREHLLLRWRLPGSGVKELLWETRLRDGSTVAGLAGTPERALPLYRQREVAMAVAVGEPMLVVESESSVDALKGWYATTWAGGAGHVNLDRLCSLLNGRSVVLVPDFDRSGLAAARRMVAAGLGPAVLLGRPGEDARDLWRRLGRDRFADAVNRALTVDRTGQAVVVDADGSAKQGPLVTAAQALGSERGPSGRRGPVTGRCRSGRITRREAAARGDRLPLGRLRRSLRQVYAQRCQLARRTGARG